MDVLSTLLDVVRLRTRIHLHARFCDKWQVVPSSDPGASFHIVGAGNCWLHVPDRPPMLLNPGDLVFVPTNSNHRLSYSAALPDSDVPTNQPAAAEAIGPSTTLLCGGVEFLNNDFNPVVVALPKYIVHPASQFQSGTLGNVVDALRKEAANGGEGSSVVQDRLADILFVEVVRLHVVHNETNSLLAAIADPHIHNALADFHGDLSGPWSLSRLADSAGMSRSAFAKQFHSMVGIAPMHYVRRWRVAYARKQLLTTNEPIYAIAEACGYAGEESFSKAFKHECGQTPMQIRSHALIPVLRPTVTVVEDYTTPTQMIIAPREVMQSLASGQVIVLDVRSRAAYLSGHIPGAVNLPETYTLLSETTADGIQEMGRVFGELFSKAGVDANQQVVVYEDSLHGQYGASCRCLFQLIFVGHLNVAILDGGLDRWKHEGYPLDSIDVQAKAIRYTPRLQTGIVATLDDVAAALSDPAIKILDNRDEAEWLGEQSAPPEYGVDFSPRRGRIPGSRWVEWTSFMVPEHNLMRFRSPEEIVSLCAQAGLYIDDQIIVYCFKGARSSNTWLAMKHAGFRHVKNYYGSWNEWSRHAELPTMSTRLASTTA